MTTNIGYALINTYLIVSPVPRVDCIIKIRISRHEKYLVPEFAFVSVVWLSDGVPSKFMISIYVVNILPSCLQNPRSEYDITTNRRTNHIYFYSYLGPHREGPILVLATSGLYHVPGLPSYSFLP